MLSICQQAATTLAIIAMVFRGLVPAGWMPNPEGMGQTALIICDMDDPGLASSHMQMAGMDMGDNGDSPAHKHSDDGHQQPCPFAAAPHFATPHSAVLLSLPSLALLFAHPREPERNEFVVAGYTPQSPRAPPALA